MRRQNTGSFIIQHFLCTQQIFNELVWRDRYGANKGLTPNLRGPINPGFMLEGSSKAAPTHLAF